MSAVIEAEPSCVWRALTDPDELCAWDESLLSPVGLATGYPCLDTSQKWRYLLRGVQVLLHERPTEVVQERRLRSSLAMGGLKFDQTYALAPDGESRTRVSIRIVAQNSVPVLGATIDRFEVRQLATERVDSLLRALQKWCEARMDAKRDAEREAARDAKSQRTQQKRSRATGQPRAARRTTGPAAP